MIVIRIPQHGDHVGMDAAPGAGAVGPVAQPTVGIGDPLTESSTRTLPFSAGDGNQTAIGSELVMDEDRLRGGSIGIDGDVHDRDVVSLGEDLSSSRGKSVDVGRPPPTKTTASEFEPVNEALAMEGSAARLAGAAAGGGKDEGGDLVDRKIPMEIEHPQDQVLAGEGALGVHGAAES